jgi:GDSL-like Lipase/Acylhydrolase family
MGQDAGYTPGGLLIRLGVLAMALALLAPAAAQARVASDSAPVKSPPNVFWIGDSYTYGAGISTPWIQGEALLTSYTLGWSPEVDAEGGTGFLADGHAADPQFAPLSAHARLSWDAQFAASRHINIVVIDAGRNDLSFPEATLRQAVVSYFRAVSRDFPNVKVVLIAPWEMKSKPTDYLMLRHLEASWAQHFGWAFIDPIDEGWVNQKSAALVCSDGVHPNVDGYDYIARHLAHAMLRALGRAALGESLAGGLRPLGTRLDSRRS